MPRLKHIIARFVGHGPNRLAAFPGVVAERLEPDLGTHQPESFDGIVGRETGQAAAYGPTTALLGQPATAESIRGRPRYLAGGLAPAHEALLYSLSDASVAGGEGIVFCPRRRLAVAETMRSWTGPLAAHPLLSAPGLPAPAALAGLTLCIATLNGEGYYHFLLECLPRLWLARAHAGRAARILCNGTPGSFQEKWLAHAGIEPGRILWVEGLSHYRCEQLLFTNYPMPEEAPGPSTVQALRELLNAHPPGRPGSRRIWISRADATLRQPAWEKALLAALPGFESVCLSGRSPAEQVDLMRSASVVAGPHGAGLTNTLFCAPGTRVIEVFPHERRQPVYARIAQACGLHHGWAVVDFTAADPGPALARAIASFAGD